MSEKLKVVWYNGMNVDKVHFEQQERYFERNLNLKTISSFSNLYGVLDLEISSDLLLQGKLKFLVSLKMARFLTRQIKMNYQSHLR